MLKKLNFDKSENGNHEGAKKNMLGKRAMRVINTVSCLARRMGMGCGTYYRPIGVHFVVERIIFTIYFGVPFGDGTLLKIFKGGYIRFDQNLPVYDH